MYFKPYKQKFYIYWFCHEIFFILEDLTAYKKENFAHFISFSCSFFVL